MLTVERLAREISVARKAVRLRQVDLAQKAGLSRATIDALENGRASEIGFSNLTRVITAVGLELVLRPATNRRPTLDELLAEPADD